MDTFSEKHKEILCKHTRAIVHMRAQLNRKNHRLGLVFGSGLNSSFDLPSWEDLVSSIASDDEIKGSHLLEMDAPSDSLSYKTEMIYQHYKRRKLREIEENPEIDIRAFEFDVAGRWIEVLRRHLYKGVNGKFEEQIKKHPYFRKLIPIIKKSQMTVTYNFDDYIERALALVRNEKEQEDSKGYEIVTTPWTQFRRENAVIYHPNGIVPYEKMEVPSDRIIFSESTFADQLLGQSSGENSGILSHLSKNTCLFIGLSLEDETLRGVLSKSARKNPGSFHYYVMYTEGMAESEEHAIRHANFQVYNLITLFLDSDGIAALLDLINCKEDDFLDLAAQVRKETRYRFYLTGPLGVGKSTAIHHLRNLMTYDEWLEPKIELLAKPWDSLSEEENNTIDNWVIKQWGLKNTRLRRDNVGIFVIDRGPIDPLAFTPENKRSDKAEKLINAYSPGESDYGAMPGTLLLLTGDDKELTNRLKVSKREGYTAEKLSTMTKDLLEVYDEDNVKKFDTTGMSVEQMVKGISEIIHLEDYKPMDMHQRLKDISGKGQ